MRATVVWDEAGFARFPALPQGFVAGFTSRRAEATGASREDLAWGLASSLGTRDAELASVNQVHGRGVAIVEDAAARATSRSLGEADALLTNVPGRLLTISTADCVPVLLLDSDTGWMAAVHAGWRGTAARILDAVLDALLARGARAGRLWAAFGPSIRKEAYEVGPDVGVALQNAYKELPDAIGAASRLGRGDRLHVDLVSLGKALLLSRGVNEEHILDCGFCTHSLPDLFPSYRRDGSGAGRLLTGIARDA